jgi:DNA-binding winged helix-turn-helix (wHTH) protein
VGIQNLIIYKLTSLYHILEELDLDLNFKISFIDNENLLNHELKNHNNYLIISNKKYPDINNQFVIENLPINIFKLIEKINIQFLKQHFIEKSELSVGKYYLDLNSRELILKDKVLKLTEKESSIIIYLNKNNDVVDITQLQSEVWGYHSKLETHTVETHIYRLRKKVFKTFEDNNFIISKKNGYQITQT